jgi:hypothetical protein
MTHNLTYIGPDPVRVGVVPLQEGWPAANHSELRPDVVEQKLASGMYRWWEASDGDEPHYRSAVADIPTPLGAPQEDAGDSEGTTLDNDALIDEAGA